MRIEDEILECRIQCNGTNADNEKLGSEWDSSKCFWKRLTLRMSLINAVEEYINDDHVSTSPEFCVVNIGQKDNLGDPVSITINIPFEKMNERFKKYIEKSLMLKPQNN